MNDFWCGGRCPHCQQEKDAKAEERARVDSKWLRAVSAVQDEIDKRDGMSANDAIFELKVTND